MSDIIFLCVSADIDLAEALADVFETAGHTIGESDGEARAAIVIWSHAAGRSGAFLGAARRAVARGGALIVTREGLDANSVEGAPVFDLSAWDFEAESSAIDPLFDAVDRAVMVSRIDEAPMSGAIQAIDDAPAAPDFTPRRVRADFGAWTRHGFGNTARALAFLAVLAGGVLGADAVLDRAAPPSPSAQASITPEVQADLYPASTEQAAFHVTFADAVTADASLDEATPVAPPPVAGRVGREPPSVSSLSRAERARAWRDAAYISRSDAVVRSAAYQPEGR